MKKEIPKDITEKAESPSVQATSPKQRYYTVTETCRRLGIRPHVLRYWEKEFEIGMKRNSAGRRIVSVQQLQKLLVIRHLLHVEKMTVAGARRRLERMGQELGAIRTGGNQRQKGTASASIDERQTLLLWLRRELSGLKTLLESTSP